VNIYDLSSKLLATIKYPYGRKEEGQSKVKKHQKIRQLPLKRSFQGLWVRQWIEWLMA